MQLRCIEKIIDDESGKHEVLYMLVDSRGIACVFSEEDIKGALQSDKNCIDNMVLCSDGKLRVYKDKKSSLPNDFKELEACGKLFVKVDKVPYQHIIWNIGSHMVKGYLPICRLSPYQNFSGGRDIDVTSLKVIRTPYARELLELSINGYGTVNKMKKLLMNKSKIGTKEYKLARKLLPVAVGLGLVYDL